MENMESLVADVCRVAREAGHFLKEERKNFSRDAVQAKRAHDYVSYVDRESERRVVEALRQLLPEAGFITEEGSAGWQGERYSWVVDPLDGTTNYIHDVAPYCVSIALRSRDELLLGVVYEPVRDECFYAWKGGGAYVNGVRMHVSDVPSLDEAYLVVELPYDAWLEAFIGRWDFSAAALMVQEAGGQVTDFYGSPSFLEGHHIVATNGALHGPLLEILREALPAGM